MLTCAVAEFHFKLVELFLFLADCRFLRIPLFFALFLFFTESGTEFTGCHSFDFVESADSFYLFAGSEIAYLFIR